MPAEEQPDALAIYDSFASTEYGRTLGENIRYGVYKPEDVSNQRWIELLGPDADNLAHLVSAYHLTNEFLQVTDRLQPGELGPRDRIIMPTGAITHDCAESITTDINYSDKTTAHEVEERAVFLAHLTHFFPDMPPETIELIREAAEEIIFNRESRLGRMFNVVERIGYLRVAMRASGHLYEGTAPDCGNGLSWLVADTISNHQLTHVIAAGRRFPAAHHFLEVHAEELERTFDVGRAAALTCFARFDIARADIKEAHFRAADQVWDSWQGEFDEDF